MAGVTKWLRQGTESITTSCLISCCVKGEQSDKKQDDNSLPKKLTDNEDKNCMVDNNKETNAYPVESKKKKKTGSAYAYDDQETSSDSDDEVLERYRKTIQKAPSQRSVKSIRSQRSVERGDGKASLMEKGRTYSPGGSAGEDSSDDESPRKQRTVRKIRHKQESFDSEDIVVEAEPDPSHMYSNEAFQRDPGSPEHHSVGGKQPEQLSQLSLISSERGPSAAGETVSVGEDEHLFDVSDLQDQEPILISKCGSVEMSFLYDPQRARMKITIHQARDIPAKERGGADNTQIRMLLLPTKKQRCKTKIKQGDSPDYRETFVFSRVPKEEVNNMGIRMRFYGCERMRRERMIGEAIVGFASLNQDVETTHWVTLEPRSNISHGDEVDVSSLSRSDSASSTQSMTHGGMPELLAGLAYNGTTGRLSVEVIKGSNFKNMAMQRPPDTYVKLTLMSPNGQEITRSKTSIRRGQPNPLFKETFMFQVALFQLPDVTLMVSVYNKRSMKRKEMIGWFSLGLNNSGEEEMAHWNDMRESKGEQVCRWHVLLES